MIIGISGKIGSGKDTIGEIIQYLCMPKGSLLPHQDSFENFQLAPNMNRIQAGWKIVKFADKLKETVSLMTGIPRADLELQSVKDSFLPEEWDRYHIRFKDGRDEPIPEGKDPVAWQRRFEHVGQVYLKHMTVRELLQKVGTDAIRNQVHYNAWRNATMAEYKGWEEKYPDFNTEVNNMTNIYRHTHCRTCNTDYFGWKRQTRCENCIKKEPILYPNWIITDVRFPNEVPPIDLLIRVNRAELHTSQEWQTMFPDMKVLDPDGWDRKNYQFSWFEERITWNEYQMRLMNSTCKGIRNLVSSQPIAPHHSETALDTYPFKNVISNDGTLEDLVEKVRVILVENKIIK